ncbi:hypothetical protein PENTCL1PPCAC_21243, partial [Pristionchus entomophagus]
GIESGNVIDRYLQREMTMTDANRRPDTGTALSSTTVDAPSTVSIGGEEEEESGLYGEYDPLRREENGIRPGSGPSNLEEKKKRMRRLRRRRTSLCIVALLTLTLIMAVLFEELHYGLAFTWFMTRYSEVVQLPITVERSENPTSIAIVIVLKDSTHDDQYALASSTIHCYAALHNYKLHVVNAAANETWKTACPQNDFMFHRHCILRHLLDGMDEEWILFLDADVGVINPNHIIEEYLPSNRSTHIVFYDRIMNHEVMAGSYLVRNSEFSRRFLKHWADASFSLPESFHGTDNGAIHIVLLEFSFPDLREGRAKCEELWRKSKDFPSLDDFVVCTRALMAGRRMDGIEIRNKTNSQRWCRDGWLTNSMWSRRDFMLHGWQKKRLDKLGFASWHSPLARAPGTNLAPLGISLAPPGTVTDDRLAAHCASAGKEAAAEWAYKDSFMGEEEEIKKRVEKEIE